MQRNRERRQTADEYDPSPAGSARIPSGSLNHGWKARHLNPHAGAVDQGRRRPYCFSPSPPSPLFLSHLLSADPPRLRQIKIAPAPRGRERKRMERDRGRNDEREGCGQGQAVAHGAPHRARWCFIRFGLVSEFFSRLRSPPHSTTSSPSRSSPPRRPRGPSGLRGPPPRPPFSLRSPRLRETGERD